MRDKKEAFIRLTEKRMESLEQIFKLMTNLANQYNYEFTKADLDDIIKRMKKMVANTESAYADVLKQIEAKATTKSTPKDKAPKAEPKPEPVAEVVQIVKQAPAESITQPTVKKFEMPNDDDVPDFLKKKAAIA